MKLTREQIENMSAGREMDALIAAQVMGHKVESNVLMWQEGKETIEPYSEGFTVLAHYSTDIAAAWEVIEKINQMITDGHLTLEDNYNYLTLEFLGDNSGYAVSFDCIVDDSEWYEQGNIEKYKYAARADTAPLAICRAALIAMMDIAQ